MTIYYERFTVRFIQTSDGFESYRDFYRAFLYTDRNLNDSVGIGSSKEEAATNLMMRLTEKRG